MFGRQFFTLPGPFGLLDLQILSESRGVCVCGGGGGAFRLFLGKHVRLALLQKPLYAKKSYPFLSVRLWTSSPKGNDRSPESNAPRSNLISKSI